MTLSRKLHTSSVRCLTHREYHIDNRLHLESDGCSKRNDKACIYEDRSEGETILLAG
jgi:hypothetical protein